jgi:hypothetical protein
MMTRRAKLSTVLALGLSAILTGCAGTQQQLPSVTPAWTASDAASQSLLYVSDIGGEVVDVFTYPSGKLIDTLTGFNEPNGECVDRSGDVFVVDTYADAILEYAHGASKPKGKLHADARLLTCSVDPKTGNLAAVPAGIADGGVYVFTRARGKAHFWSGGSLLEEAYSCTYDPDGNLYVAGQNSEGEIQLARYAEGTFGETAISLDIKVGWPGGMLWIGNYLALGDQFANKFNSAQKYPNVVYEIHITGANGSVVRKAGLHGAGDVVQFWVASGKVIGADAEDEVLGFWKFPAGGKRLSAITGFYEPAGVVMSASQ